LNLWGMLYLIYYDPQFVTVWPWHHANPIPKFPTIKIKEKKMKNKKNKRK